MSSFLLDENGDLDTTMNRLSLTTGLEAIRQHLLVKFRLFLGEWFLDQTVGVPYFQDIFVKAPSIAAVSEILKLQILETPGVIELLEFDYDFQETGRTFILKFKALTEEGIIDFSELIGV